MALCTSLRDSSPFISRVIIIPFIKNPKAIDNTIQAENEALLREHIKAASCLYGKMVYLERAFETPEQQTQLQEDILPRVSKLCPGIESRVVKGISLVVHHGMILRDALEDSEDQLNLSDDSIWKYVENVIIPQGVQRYYTATPDITPSSAAGKSQQGDVTGRVEELRIKPSSSANEAESSSCPTEQADKERSTEPEDCEVSQEAEIPVVCLTDHAEISPEQESTTAGTQGSMAPNDETQPNRPAALTHSLIEKMATNQGASKQGTQGSMTPNNTTQPNGPALTQTNPGTSKQGLQGSTEANISQSGEPGQFIKVVHQIDFQNDVQRTRGGNKRKNSSQETKVRRKKGKQDNTEYKYCICKQKMDEKEEENMVLCRNNKRKLENKCPGNKYFHLKCLKLKTVPKQEPWYCNWCRKLYSL